MRRALLFGVLAACYSPQPQTGIECAPGGICPDPLVCSPATNTCEHSAVGSGRDAGPSDAPPDGEALTVDAPNGPANDLAAGATAITDTTQITEDITYAHDDEAPGASPGCGLAGGRDVYFKLTIPFDQVWYFDTFGSSYDTVIHIYDGSCVDGTPPSGQACRNNQCATSQSQTARELASGDHCIVIDENGPGTGPAMLVLNVEKGGHPGTQLASGTNTVTGNNCSSGSFRMASCGGSGPEDGYFTTSCPGVTTMLTASTCAAATTSDTALWVTGPGTTELACNDDDAACLASTTGASTISNVALTGAHLFWVVVDSYGTTSPACGAYSLTTTLQ